MESDLFTLFRGMLCIVVTVYTVVRLAQSLWRWHQWLWTADRSRQFVRGYLWAQLLRVRLRRLGADVLQILILAVILYEVIRWHDRI